REIDTKRLEAAVAPAEVEPFVDFDRHPLLVKGYIGPAVLGEKSPTGIRYLLDPRVVPGSAWITGANEPGRHVFDLVTGRDFTGDGTIEAAEVRDGDACPVDGGRLETSRGIEIGHIFQLGRKYAEALGLQVLDEHGRLVTVTMGSYGIGVSRAVAAVVEATYDDLGLCWPREVAPADVHVVATGKDAEVFDTGDRVAAELEAADVRVLYDDRQRVSPGVKFKDAELLGVPTILVIGRGLADGTVEIRDRRTGDRQEVPVGEAVARLTAIVRS
ncbi:MAG: His/Gly/Thr/Pro-type tRNA ligase C-terminal domain-containing protein, partial [Kineosporiaceae bacterium]